MRGQRAEKVLAILPACCALTPDTRHLRRARQAAIRLQGIFALTGLHGVCMKPCILLLKYEL